jgi:hypothetical protein
MRCSPAKRILPIALLAIGTIHADPIVYIKNKSDRTVHVRPFIGDYAFQPQRIKPADKGPKESEAIYMAGNLGIPGGNLDNTQIDGIRVTYCMSSDPKYTQCNIDPSVLSASGKEYEFKFTKKARDAAKKYYLKLTIEDDQAVLEPQKGILGKTENRKWSLSGNIKGGDENIKGPTPFASTAGVQKPTFSAPPTDTPPALPEMDSVFSIKNNSSYFLKLELIKQRGGERTASVFPDATNTLPKIEGPLTGFRVIYSPTSMDSDVEQARKNGKIIEFTFNAPNKRKYFLEINMDKNGGILLMTQKDEDIYTKIYDDLGDNIKQDEISRK